MDKIKINYEKLPAEFLNSPYMLLQQKKYIDNYNLLCLQELYLSGDPSAWANLWQYSYNIAFAIINTQCKEKQLFYNKSDRMDKALYSCEYLLRRYEKYKKKGKIYKVKKNYISAIKMACIHSLYYQTKSDKINNSALKFESFSDQYKQDVFIAENIKASQDSDFCISSCCGSSYDSLTI